MKPQHYLPSIKAIGQLGAMNRQAFMLILSLCVYILSSSLSAQVSVNVSDQKPRYLLGPYLSYIEDKNNNLSLNDVRKMFLEGNPIVEQNFDDVVNLGVNNSVFWFSFTIDAEESIENRPISWFLEIVQPLLAEAELFVFYGQSTTPSDQEKFLGKRDGIIKARNVLFEMHILHDTSIDVIVKLKSFSFAKFTFNLWRADALVKNNPINEYWFGVYFGIMIVMLIYNLVIYFLTRLPSYIYYMIYLLSILTFFIIYSGVINEYVIGHFSVWSEKAPLFLALIATASSVKFGSVYIELEKIAPKFNRLLNVLLCLILIYAFVSLKYPFELLLPAIIAYPLLSIILGFVVYYARFKGVIEVMVVLSSFLIMFFSVLLFIGGLLAIIPVTLLIEISMYFGSATQTLLISFALANQINIERRERYQALIGENQAVRNLRSIEESSFNRVMLDSLTGFPNRVAIERFEETILDFKQGACPPMAVCLISLENFLQINHTLGFRSSDLLMENFSKRLDKLVQDIPQSIPFNLPGENNYHIAKLDGTSFAILFKVNIAKEEFLKIISNLLVLLNRPINIRDMTLEIKVKTGVAFAPEHSTNLFTLFRFAQAALDSEDTLESSVILYSSVLSQQATRRLHLINDLRDAIEANQLELVYQPQLDITKQKITTIETLVRWDHPEYGGVNPSEFIMLAEQTGLINEMTEWVVAKSFEDLLWLLEKGLDFNIAINISAKNLIHEGFMPYLKSLTQKLSIPAEKISLELTEVSLMQRPKECALAIEQLHAFGIKITIDDFGAGHSSLSYIKQLPLSFLKIDQSLVTHIDSRHDNYVITKSIIALGHEMRVKVCAEGVETASCLKMLQQFKCDRAQGFHIAKPLPREDLLNWLNHNAF